MDDIKLEPMGTLSSRTYDTLRSALISGVFAPGERFRLADLAKRLGTSITPVRESCLRLISEQALEMRPGRQVAVPALSLSRYTEIRTIRLLLEGKAAALASQTATRDDISRLRDIQHRFTVEELAGNHRGALDLNHQFHFGVYRLCGMEMLVDHIENMWLSMGPIHHSLYVDMRSVYDYVGAEEHVNLLDALANRDADAAARAIEQDILRAGEAIIRTLSRPGFIASKS